MIRAAALLAIAATLAGACATGTRRQHHVASGALFGGAVLAFANGVHNINACDARPPSSENSFNDGCEGAGMGSALLASALIIGSLVAYFSAPDADERVAAAAPPRTRGPAVPPMNLPLPPTDDPALRQLTLQAEVAARRGDCALVAVVADQIAARDPEYRTGGFVEDPRISTCLAHDAPPQ